MEIREDKKPPRQVRSTLQFPELRKLQAGQCAVYDIDMANRVRASIAHLRKSDGLEFITRTYPDDNEIKVWLKESTK